MELKLFWFWNIYWSTDKELYSLKRIKIKTNIMKQFKCILSAPQFYRFQCTFQYFLININFEMDLSENPRYLQVTKKWSKLKIFIPGCHSVSFNYIWVVFLVPCWHLTYIMYKSLVLSWCQAVLFHWFQYSKHLFASAEVLA